MICPHCGADVPSGSAFCYSCRKRLSGSTAAAPPAAGETAAEAAALGRPGVVVAIAILDFLGVAVALLAGGLMLFAAVNNAEGRMVLAGLGLLALLLAALQLACGLGLLWLKPWARTLQIVLACLSICNLLSILVLVYLLRPGVKLLFSGRPVLQMSELELQLVKRQATLAGGGAAVVAAVVVVGVLLVPAMIAVIGIVAAIAIPSLLRARVSANEAAAIGNLRTVASAQASYQGANGGLYEGQATCLAQPATCLPGYSGPAFLDETLAQQSVSKNGYVLRLLPGPGGDFDAGRQSPTSVSTYVWLAEPVQHGRTGLRSFCVDQTGIVCATSGSLSFENQDGSGCPVDLACSPLR